MSLHYYLWQSPYRADYVSFVYWETSTEKWWCLSPLLKYYGVKTPLLRLLQKYKLADQPMHRWGDFAPPRRGFSKQTLLISTSTFVQFLDAWNRDQLRFTPNDLAEFKSELQMAKGSPGLPPGEAIEAISDSYVKRPEPEHTLLQLIRVSLTISLTANEFLEGSKRLSGWDVSLFKEYISQLSEYVEDLPLQTLSTKNDFIDVSSTELIARPNPKPETKHKDS
jgi:hypothetical protein